MLWDIASAPFDDCDDPLCARMHVTQVCPSFWAADASAASLPPPPLEAFQPLGELLAAADLGHDIVGLMLGLPDLYPGVPVEAEVEEAGSIGAAVEAQL